MVFANLQHIGIAQEFLECEKRMERDQSLGALVAEVSSFVWPARPDRPLIGFSEPAVEMKVLGTMPNAWIRALSARFDCASAALLGVNLMSLYQKRLPNISQWRHGCLIAMSQLVVPLVEMQPWHSFSPWRNSTTRRPGIRTRGTGSRDGPGSRVRARNGLSGCGTLKRHKRKLVTSV